MTYQNMKLISFIESNVHKYDLFCCVGVFKGTQEPLYLTGDSQLGWRFSVRA